MDWNDIKEAVLVAGYGNEIPQSLNAIINIFMKRKSVFHPEPFTLSDFAACCTIYEMTEAARKAKKNG